MDDNKRLVYNKFGMPATQLLFPSSNQEGANAGNTKRSKKTKQSGIKAADFQKFKKGIFLQLLVYYGIHWVITFYTTINENPRVALWCYFGLGAMLLTELYIQQLDAHFSGGNIEAYYPRTREYIVSLLHTLQSGLSACSIPLTLPVITEFECIQGLRLFYPLYMNSVCRCIIPSLGGYVLPSGPVLVPPPTAPWDGEAASTGTSAASPPALTAVGTGTNPATPAAAPGAGLAPLPGLHVSFATTTIDPVDYVYAHCCVLVLNHNIMYHGLLPVLHSGMHRTNTRLEESRLTATKGTPGVDAGSVKDGVPAPSDANNQASGVPAVAAAATGSVSESYHWSVYLIVFIVLRLVFYGNVE